MADEIRIEDLHVRAIIGINGEERRERQDVLINLSSSSIPGPPDARTTSPTPR
jgi:dihydroneopterin aldolase